MGTLSGKIRLKNMGTLSGTLAIFSVIFDIYWQLKPPLHFIFYCLSWRNKILSPQITGQQV